MGNEEEELLLVALIPNNVGLIGFSFRYQTNQLLYVMLEPYFKYVKSTLF